ETCSTESAAGDAVATSRGTLAFIASRSPGPSGWTRHGAISRRSARRRRRQSRKPSLRWRPEPPNSSDRTRRRASVELAFGLRLVEAERIELRHLMEEAFLRRDADGAASVCDQDRLAE